MRTKQAIVATSIASSTLWEDEVVWAARGASARNAQIAPHTRKGWYRGLESFSLLSAPLPLDSVRARKQEISEQLDELGSSVGSPTYFPFELGSRRPMRPMQGYLFKLPRFFVSMFHQLADAGHFVELPSENLLQIGCEYRLADEVTAVAQCDPFTTDPALVERALKGHATTQNRVAEHLLLNGVEPRSPLPDEPNFDLAWKVDGTVWVAEIKSVTDSNEERQLRLGLGQVLRYRQLLQGRGNAEAALVLEREPSDSSWIELCASLGVLLLWPDRLSEIPLTTMS